MKQLLYAACIIALCPTAVFAQGICDPSGNIIIFSNYDGGTLNLEIDEDIPNLRIGICSYESVTVNISGDYSENVEEVVYAGYDADDVSAVTGVPPAIVEILVIPPATLDDPDGYPYIICAYECDTDYVPGGCNTVEQVTDFFLTELSGTFRYSYLQYAEWSGTFYISDGGNCCYDGVEDPAMADVGVTAITAPVSGCGLSVEYVTVTIQNFGAGEVSDIPVYYNVDGGPVVMETYDGSLEPGGTLEYTFSVMADLSVEGTHTINAYTDYADDGVYDNNDYSIEVEALATPDVDLGEDQSACDELTLDAENPGAVYAWSTGATTQEIVVTETGGYSVTVTNPASGCSTSDNINIEILPSPIASFTYTVSSLNVTFTNTSSAGTYTWDFGDGSPTSNATSPGHDYSTSGSYTVTLIVSNECGDDVYTTVVDVGGNEIIELGDNISLQIFPNPASDKVQLCLQGPAKESIWFALYSVNGDLLIASTALSPSGDCTQLNLGRFSPGMYLLQVYTPKLTAATFLSLQ